MFADLIKQATKVIQYYEDQGDQPTERESIDKLVHPFMEHVLGVDYRDPTAVKAEYDADISRSKGEKVDYAILRDGEPVILIECKALNTSLNGKESQLKRYIGALSHVSLGILTDGRHYRFYADLDQPNILDNEPFLCVDLMKLTSEATEQLKRFHTDCLDVEALKEAGRGWKTVAAIMQMLESEWMEPSREYVEVFARRLHVGPVTGSVRKRYANYLRQAHRLFLPEGTTAATNGDKSDNGICGSPEPRPGDEPSGDWKPLTELATASKLYKNINAICFADGSSTQVDSWAGLLRTIVQKLDSEGHFSADDMPSRLQYYIKRTSEHDFRQYVELPSGWAVNVSLGQKDILKRAIAFLQECEHDPKQVHIEFNSEPPPVTPSDEFRPLTTLNPAGSAPRVIRFEDGTEEKIKSWADLFRAIARKLAAEGHFQPERLVRDLHGTIREQPPAGATVQWIELGDHQYIRDHGSASDRFKGAVRLLTLCGHDPDKCTAK